MNCQLQPHLPALRAYLDHVLTDGDALNDWLTHLPLECQQPVYYIGAWLSLLIGA
jgi:hypothetical protein